MLPHRAAIRIPHLERSPFPRISHEVALVLLEGVSPHLLSMVNGYSEKYEAAIKLELEDPNETVRDFTRRICSKLGISL